MISEEEVDDPKWWGNWSRDKRNYVNFDGRTRVLTLHLPAGSDKSFCSLPCRGRTAKEDDEAWSTSSRAVPSPPSSFCSSDLFTRGEGRGWGGCVNGVSTYSRSEVQIERKVTMRAVRYTDRAEFRFVLRENIVCTRVSSVPLVTWRIRSKLLFVSRAGD